MPPAILLRPVTRANVRAVCDLAGFVDTGLVDEGEHRLERTLHS
jgi:hypothetical protein